MYPDAPLIKRQGEVNAWDNAQFREAIKQANRTQIIVAGIVTDVCTAFLARSLRAEGYSVWANLEASGTTTKEVCVPLYYSSFLSRAFSLPTCHPPSRQPSCDPPSPSA